MLKIMQELDRLENEIKDAEADVSKLEGSNETLLDQLEKTFDITTFEEAEALLEKKLKEQNKVGKKIEADFDKLYNDYDW